jgi:hypothetical protein
MVHFRTAMENLVMKIKQWANEQQHSKITVAAVILGIVPDFSAGKTVPVNGKIAKPTKVGSELTIAQVKVGMRVRVMGLDKAGVISKDVFTIRAFRADEPTPGPGWFAIDNDRSVHFSDLRVA